MNNMLVGWHISIYDQHTVREVLEQGERVYYGDLRPADPPVPYYTIDLTVYSDYSGDTVNRANCNEFLKRFGKEPGVHEVYGGYGTRGVLLSAAALENEEIREVIDGLEDYPLINDESLSELEIQLVEEWVEYYCKWDLKARLLKDGIYDEDSIPEQEDLIQLAFEAINRMEESGRYFIFQDAVNAYIDLDWLMEYWKGEESNE